MIIDFAKDGGGGILGIPDIWRVQLTGPEIEEKNLYRASDNKILEPEDFLEYGIDFIPEKYKFSSKFPLEYLSKSDKELISNSTEDLESIGKVLFPTYSSDIAQDTTISYFGAISVSGQTLVLVKCPAGCNQADFYTSEHIKCITVRFGGEKSVDTGEFVELQKCAYEVESSKIVWMVIGQDGLVKDINLSYRAWSSSINPFRNLNTQLLRNDEFYKYLANPEIIEKSQGTDIWLDKNSGTLIGNEVLPESRTPILSGKIKAVKSGGVTQFSPSTSYKKGALVSYSGREWLSLVDNNLGEQSPQLSSKWILKDKLLASIQKYLTLQFSESGDKVGKIYPEIVGYEEGISHDIKFKVDLEPGTILEYIELKDLGPYESARYNERIYTRPALSELDKCDFRTFAINKILKHNDIQYYASISGSGYSGYTVDIAPLSGNVPYKEGSSDEIKTISDEEYLKKIHTGPMMSGGLAVLKVKKVPIPVRLCYSDEFSGGPKDINIERNYKDNPHYAITGNIKYTANITAKQYGGKGGYDTFTVFEVPRNQLRYSFDIELKPGYKLKSCEAYYLESVQSKITRAELSGKNIDVLGSYALEESPASESYDLCDLIGVRRDDVSVTTKGNTVSITDEITKNGAPLFVINIVKSVTIVKVDLVDMGGINFFEIDGRNYGEFTVGDDGKVKIDNILQGSDWYNLNVFNSFGVIETIDGQELTHTTSFERRLPKLDIVFKSECQGLDEPISITLENVTRDITLEFRLK